MFGGERLFHMRILWASRICEHNKYAMTNYDLLSIIICEHETYPFINYDFVVSILVIMRNVIDNFKCVSTIMCEHDRNELLNLWFKINIICEHDTLEAFLNCQWLRICRESNGPTLSAMTTNFIEHSITIIDSE